MNRIFQTALSAVTSLCLSLALTPLPAFAEEQPNVDVVNQSAVPVATVLEPKDSSGAVVDLWMQWSDESQSGKYCYSAITAAKVSDGLVTYWFHTIPGKDEVKCCFIDIEETVSSDIRLSIPEQVKIGDKVYKTTEIGFSAGSPNKTSQEAESKCTMINKLDWWFDSTGSGKFCFEKAEDYNAWVETENKKLDSKKPKHTNANIVCDEGRGASGNVSVGNRVSEVVIPSGVTSIGSQCFRSMTNLKRVIFSDRASLKTIEALAFEGCSSLKSITVPNGVETLGSVSYYRYNDANDVYNENQGKYVAGANSNTVISSGQSPVRTYALGQIPGNVFVNCSSLENISLPNSLIEIGSSCFGGCSALSTITIPSNVSVFGEAQLGNASSLEAVNLEESNNRANCSVDGILYNAEKTKVQFVPLGRKVIASMPDTVTDLGDKFVSDCKQIQSVYIGKGVAKLSGVSTTPKLEEIVVAADDVTVVPTAFDGCSSLKKITFLGSEVTFKWRTNIKRSGSKKKGYTYDVQSTCGPFYQTDTLNDNLDIVFADPKCQVNAKHYITLNNNDAKPITETDKQGVSDNAFSTASARTINDDKSFISRSLNIFGGGQQTEKFFTGSDENKFEPYYTNSGSDPVLVNVSYYGWTVKTNESQTYCGDAIVPEITVNGTDANGNVIQIDSSKYTVNVTDNTDVGTATVSVSGIGDYAGQKGITSFSIVPASISAAKIDIIPNQTFTGSAITPEVTATISIGDSGKVVNLASGSDFDVDYSNNLSTGVATVTIKGKRNYTGTASTTFQIVAPAPAAPAKTSISGATIAPIADQGYTGKAVEPAVSVSLSGTALALGTDYTVSYSSNTEVGTATVTVTGTGNYTGSVSATFKIVAGKDGLASAIKAAQDAVAAEVAVSEAGDGSDVAAGTAYVTKAQVDALANAIKEAQAVAAKEAATDAEVTKATADIQAATKTYTDAAASQKGTKAAEPGTDPGTEPGTDPGTEPGTDPADEAPAKGDKVDGVAAGKTVTVDVAVTGTATVTISGVNAKSGATVTLDTVTIAGKTYKVTAIAAKALKGTKAKKVTVGANVKTIGASAFANAKKLASVTLGKNVKSVGKAAFKGDVKLKTITVKSAKLTKKGVKGMLKGSSVKTIKVKVGSKKANKKLVKKYKKIFTKANCGKKVTVK